ncbi:MAG TPA: L-2-hydroxyglutarate oxidase [Candidatus Methylacidiphilales bacterium]
MSQTPRKIAVVGGGIIGLATAYRFLQAEAHRGAEVVVYEKDARPGLHQTTHNSGVLHCGLYYKPGSLKARLAVSGIREMAAFCAEHGVAHEICGKLVVAVDEAEVARLRNLHERGTANGLSGLEWLGAGPMREVEPHVAGIAALRVPQEGIVDYAQVVAALVREIGRLGGTVKCGAGLRRAVPEGSGWRLHTAAGDFAADFLVNCAGLHSDRVAGMAGERSAVKIVPFRGEYYELKPERRHLVRHLIYPVPDPAFPFLGVHFTRMIHGGVEAGPNAVLAWAREGYRKSDINPADLWDALSFPGLWKFLNKHRRMCWEEIERSWSKRLFCASLQRLVPEVEIGDLAPGGSGVRAQAMDPSGELVQDFALIRRPNALHVVNAPSPGATASLAIGSEIVRLVGENS